MSFIAIIEKNLNARGDANSVPEPGFKWLIGPSDWSVGIIYAARQKWRPGPFLLGVVITQQASAVFSIPRYIEMGGWQCEDASQ